MAVKPVLLMMALVLPALAVPNLVTAAEPVNDVSVIEDLPNEESQAPAEVVERRPSPAASQPSAAQQPVQRVSKPTVNPSQASDGSLGEASVIVMVDRTQQLITISSPGTRDLPDGLLVGKVSTGGGWKTPNNPRNPRPAYCANNATPTVDRMTIKAIPGQTMYETYYSNTFSDGEQNPIPMPYAIHVKDGVYLHQVPPGKEKFLGMNVSGGCIRLPRKIARFLYRELETYQELQLSIFGPNPPTVPGLNDCQQQAQGQSNRHPIGGGQDPYAQPSPFPQLQLPEFPLQKPIENLFKGLFGGG